MAITTIINTFKKTMHVVVNIAKVFEVRDLKTSLKVIRKAVHFYREQLHGPTHSDKIVAPAILELESLNDKLLTIEQANKKEILLADIAKADEDKDQLLYQEATRLIDKWHQSKNTTSLETNEVILKQKLHRLINIENLILRDQVVELAAARIILEKCNKKQSHQGNVAKVAYLAAVHKDETRLSHKKYHLRGEAFLHKKIQQLSFLFDGLDHMDWELYFIDDEAIGIRSSRTIDKINELLEIDHTLSPFKSKVKTLDPQNLTAEIQSYALTEINQLTPAQFTKKSVKGGSIQIGLKYLANSAQNYQVICYLDCHTSVNAASSGLLIGKIYSNATDIAIGSRHVEGAHIIGKSYTNQLQSKLFNQLIQSLLELPIRDTQLGAKAFRPAVIQTIHEQFQELGMAFDVELLKLAQQSGFTLCEVGLVWHDPGMESQSRAEGQNMFYALLRINDRLNPDFKLSHLNINEVISLFDTPISQWDLSKEISSHQKLFNNIATLFSQPEFEMMLRYLDSAGPSLIPKKISTIFYELNNLIQQILMNESHTETLVKVISLVGEFLMELKPSSAGQFLIAEYPHISSLIKLTLNNPAYVKLFIPMIFGTRFQLTEQNNSISFIEFASKHSTSNPLDAFITWHANSFKAHTNKTPLTLTINSQQPIKLILTLSDINQTNDLLTILACLNATNLSHKNIISVQVLSLVKIENETQILSDYETLNLSFTHSSVQNFSRNLRQAIAENSNAHIGICVADLQRFSNFTDILQGLPQPTTIISENEATIYVASRYKQPSYTLQQDSIGLLFTLFARSLLPTLHRISDPLYNTGILINPQAAAQIQITSNYRPDNFYLEVLSDILNRPTTQIIEIPAQANQYLNFNTLADYIHTVESLLDLTIRLEKSAAQSDFPKFLAAGAENSVFLLDEHTILKISHEIYDPYFMGILKNVLLKNQSTMTINEQHKKLISGGLVQEILQQPLLSGLIPKLRSWALFNAFVMKVITAIENKDYKSVGYSIALAKGRDLIVPFRFIENLSLHIDGRTYHFNKEDKVIQSRKVNAIFRDRVQKLLTNQIPENCLIGLRALIEQAVQLQYKLWYRGLIDLDMNFMCDTGFITDSNYQEVLMSLDPGEITDQPDEISTHCHFSNRYDYNELRMLLNTHAPTIQEEVLAYFIEIMNEFYQFIEDDLKHAPDNRQFASQQNVAENTILFPLPSNLSNTNSHNDQAAHIYREGLQKSRIGQQKIACANEKTPLLTGDNLVIGKSFIHMVSPNNGNINQHPNEIRHTIGVGSIMPCLNKLNETGFLVNDDKIESQIVVLNSGEASRSSLMKYVDHNIGKGFVKLFKNSLYLRSVAEFEKLRTRLAGCTIILATDEMIEMNKDAINSIVDYFNQPSRPGFYWCDLAPEVDYLLPMTQQSLIVFLKVHSKLSETIREFLAKVPILSQISFTDIDATCKTIFDKISSHHTASTTTLHDRSLDLSLLKDLLQQYLIFTAIKEQIGTKTPFFMVFRNSFLHEFYNTIVSTLPNSVSTKITWESLLIRALKADEWFWIKNGRPHEIPPEQWLKIYQVTQHLKTKHGISNDEQSKHLRHFASNWHNFDDPSSIIAYYKKSEPLMFTRQIDNIKILSDVEIADTLQVNNHLLPDVNVCLIANNCKIQGTLNIIYQHTSQKKLSSVAVVLCNVLLEENQELTIFANHIVNQVDGQTLSTDLTPTAKSELLKQSVYNCSTSQAPDKLCVLAKLPITLGLTSRLS